MEGSCVTSAAASRKAFSNTNLSSSGASYLWEKKKTGHKNSSLWPTAPKDKSPRKKL